MTKLDKLLKKSFGHYHLKLATKVFLEYLTKGSVLWYAMEGDKELKECMLLFIALYGCYDVDVQILSDLLNIEFKSIKDRL